MAANWTAFTSGAVLLASELNGVVDNFADIAIFNETQAQNTAGGTFTSGSWVKRTLNTTEVNNIAGCSLASSVITLATAGTYLITAQAPAAGVNRHQIRFENTSDATTEIIGSSEFNNGQNTCSFLMGIVTIAASKNFELQHRCQTTINTDGLGVQANFSSEVYSQIMIRRIA